MTKQLLLAAAWLALGISPSSKAAPLDEAPYTFYITNFSHHHLADDMTEFSVTFNAPPQLLDFDFAQRAKGTFQYYISPYAEEPLPPSVSYAYIFRAPENAQQGNTLRVRKGYTTGSSDPGSGGWGDITEETPLFIQGNTVTFTLHDGSFGYAPGRALRYEIGSYVYGATTSLVSEVPEPEAHALLMAGGLAALAMFGVRRRHLRAPARSAALR